MQSAREARRRKILERGTDRLALITGERKSVEPPSDSHDLGDESTRLVNSDASIESHDLGFRRRRPWMELSIFSACDLKNVHWRYGGFHPYDVPSQVRDEFGFNGRLERTLKLKRPTGRLQEVGTFQIFVKIPSGISLVLWVSAEDIGETLTTLIVQKEGYSPTLFYILHEGKVLQEGEKLRDCQIYKNSTLHVMYRLRGGTGGNRGIAGPSSYKDAA